jgi:O-antigen biosynthesis protein
MKLSIIVPVWNNWSATKSCLSDLSRLPDDHEIIVADDASTDNTPKLLAKEFPRVKRVRADKNGGFAKNCNRGYAASTGDYVCFLNNDIKVQRNHETWTIPVIEAASRGGLVGPTIGVLGPDFAFITESNKMPTRGYAYMSGWCITASRGVWERLIPQQQTGPFEEAFPMFFEDASLSFAAKELGILLEIVPVPIRHFGHLTTKRLDINGLYRQSRAIFTEKWKTKLNGGLMS